MAKKGDGISVHRWTFCATCKRESPKRTKPADDCKRCKVAAWRVFYRDPDGNKKSKVFDCAKVPNAYEEAKAFRAKVVTTKRDGTYVDPAAGRQPFPDYAEEWAAAQDWKEGTQELWPTRRKRLVRYVGAKATLGSITKTKLLTIRKELGKEYVRSTVTQTMHLLLAIMRSAAEDGKIPRDPTIGVDAAPKKRGDDTSGTISPEKVPTYGEACTILGAAPDPYRGVHAIGLAGLRIGEALGMGLDRIIFPEGVDVDPDNLAALADLPDNGDWADNVKIVVDRQLVARKGSRRVFTTTKAEKVRTITAPRLVALEIRDHLAAGYGGWWTDESGATRYMLFMRNELPVIAREFYSYGWDPAVEAAGFKGRFTFHGYRHLVASQLLSDGTAMPAVAGYIGDHQHTVMRVYAHWLRDDQDVPSNVLNRAFAAPVKLLPRTAKATPDASRLRDASQMPHAA